MNSHGGKRGGGRPSGSRNKIKVEVETAAQRVQKCVDGGLTPLEYLLAVMRDEAMPYPIRMEAAKDAAPYVHRKLQDVDVSVAGLPQIVTIVVPPL